MTLAGGGQRTGRAHDVLFDIRRFTNERRAIPEAHKGGDVAARALDNRRDRSAGLLVRVEPGPGEQVPAQKTLTDDLRAHDVLFDIRRFTNERRAIPEAHKGGDVAARALDNRRDRSAGLLVRVEPGPGEQVPAQKTLTDDLRA